MVVTSKAKTSGIQAKYFDLKFSNQENSVTSNLKPKMW